MMSSSGRTGLDIRRGRARRTWSADRRSIRRGWRRSPPRIAFGHVVERDLVAVQQVHVAVDLHFRLEPAGDVRAEHAGDRLELVLQVLRDASSAGEARLSPPDIHEHDREFAEVDLRDDRVEDVVGKLRAGRVDLVAHAAQRVVDVDPDVELHADGGEPLLGGGGDLLDVLERLEIALQRLGDESFDIGRRRRRCTGWRR